MKPTIETFYNTTIRGIGASLADQIVDALSAEAGHGACASTTAPICCGNRFSGVDDETY